MLSIDVHHHILPDFFWREPETNEQSPVGGIAPPPWSKESALAFLDEASIDVAVTSISSPGVHMGDDARARRRPAARSPTPDSNRSSSPPPSSRLPPVSDLPQHAPHYRTTQDRE
jgi:hypothetical protein